jgi:N-methylhydantoinase A
MSNGLDLTSAGGSEPRDGSLLRFGVDVGGTFVDFVIFDPATGAISIDKAPSRPDELAEAFVGGIRKHVTEGVRVESIFHGTTYVINTLLQNQGVPTGLLTTKGFRDVLEIGRGGRKAIYDWSYLPPPPAVPRYLRREISERVAADGSVIAPLDLEEVDREAHALVAEGVEAIAVCFLHSYRNPAHELTAVEHLRRTFPGVASSCSVELTQEWGEYERTSTACLNASVQPRFGAYVDRLTDRLRAVDGGRAPLGIMQSSGGIMTADRAARQPIRTLESGPAAGVIGAHALARALGVENVICADVGGTSLDIALIDQGRIVERTRAIVEGRPVVGETIDITSIGAGGGSVGWIDERGLLRVGPRSAGAIPGPACFGFGGTEATLTDCNLLLGRINPDNFAGGAMKLDPALSLAAIERTLVPTLGLPPLELAAGMLAIADDNMASAVRRITVERGLDPRDFTLLSYGGGGGLFAAATAAALSIRSVVVPPFSAAFSACGILLSDYRVDLNVTRVRPLVAEASAGVVDDLAGLERRAREELGGYGVDFERVEVHYRLDLRYRGQEHTISVELPGSAAAGGEDVAAAARGPFVERHRRLYGHGEADGPIELVACRCRAIGITDRPMWGAPNGTRDGRSKGTRDVYFAETGEFVESTLYDCDALRRDQLVAGPAVIEEWATTIVIPPGWTASIGAVGELRLSRTDGEGE